MTLGEKIRDLRKKNNMTMDDLARELGVQRSAINKYEKGIVVNLKRSTILGLCRVFGVSSSYFLDDADSVEAEDMEFLESLHRDPELRLLFDRTRKMSHDDVVFIRQFVERMKSGRDSE